MEFYCATACHAGWLARLSQGTHWEWTWSRFTHISHAIVCVCMCVCVCVCVRARACVCAYAHAYAYPLEVRGITSVIVPSVHLPLYPPGLSRISAVFTQVVTDMPFSSNWMAMPTHTHTHTLTHTHRHTHTHTHTLFRFTLPSLCHVHSSFTKHTPSLVSLKTKQKTKKS